MQNTLINAGFTDMTEDDCLAQYLQFQEIMGMYSSGHTNGISYGAYCKNFFILAFDFTANAKASNMEMVPTTRSGAVNIKLDFDRPLPFEVKMVVFTENNGTATLTPDRVVRTSYGTTS